MNSHSLVWRCVPPPLFAGCALFTTAHLPTVHAQETGAETTVEEIVVTGSRLRRDRDFVELSPVQTIGLEEIQASGNITLEETLNQYPQLVPSNTSVTNQSGGEGVLTSDLRGLGAVRTLVLVDGRRFIPADVTGLTDLATIPDMLVERVEIVTGGASAVYGSDAIAGAVNFIMRDDFEGAELRYQFGETTEGDGANNKIDFLLGVNSADDRGNVTLHGSYTDRDAIFFADRSFSAVSLLADGNGVLQELKLPTIPGGHINIPTPDFDQIQGVDLIGAQADCPGPVQGLRFGEGSVPLPFCLPLDGFDFPALNYLLRPLERWQITALGDYEINDAVAAFAQLTYTNKENAYQQAPDSVRPASPGEETGTLLIPSADTNPTFPQVLQDFFAANQAYFDPDDDGVFTVRNIAYRAAQLGARTVTTQADSYGLTAGFRGDFDIGGNAWFWDAFYQQSRSDVSFVQANRLSQTRLALGLDPVPTGDGGFQCRVGQVFGCVPLNFFGTDALTDEMIDFLRVTAARQDRLTRELAVATLAGDLLELPAGPLASAFGIEWRKEEFSTTPNDVLLSGEVGSPPFPVVRSGEFDVLELFGEVRLPLFGDLPGIDSLAIEAAVRFSDYSTVGSVTTWRGAVDWQVNDWARIRGGLSRAIRAPNLNELFAQRTLGFDGGSNDPCTQELTPAERELCIQQGVPPELVDDFEEIEPGFFALRGGNPDLTEEEADTLTIGVVFTPMDALSLAIDYYDIEITDAISPVTAQVIAETCFALLDINSPECRAINRLSNGQIDFVDASLLNVATRSARGLDVSARYGLELPNYLALPGEGADLQLTLVATRQLDKETRVIDTEPTIECAGFFGGPCSSDSVRITPDLSALLRANWVSGPADVSVQLNYIGALDLHPDAFPIQKDRVGALYYVDLNGGYQIGDRIRIFAGVQNLFDKAPPIIGLRAGGDSNTNVETYDPLGRRYFFGASVGF